RAEAARTRAEEALRNARERQDVAEAEEALRRAVVRLRIARGGARRGRERPAG
ncbi:MAG: F0F1 ATP synthase subunit epsilon, partial [Chloroflexota bacterium]|nr:F0F1 ATP synthase subunit epsilon [Chloroflexota bacterium]